VGTAEGQRRRPVSLLRAIRARASLSREILRNAHADPVVEGNPLVSVVIATYNWSSVLRYAVRSVLWQTHPHLELIVVGDCCTDDSEEVVASFGDPRVRWHNLERNSGSQATPNNAGLELARGEYVAYQGHDDVWHPKHLATMVSHMQRESADFAFGLAEVLGPPGSRVRRLSGTDVEPGSIRLGNHVPPTSIVHELDLGRRIGWRTWEEGDGPPDMNFLGRSQNAARRMIRVPALTAFKFPSVMRTNSYRERPSHEQRAYVERIERERLLIERELAALALRRIIPRAEKLPGEEPTAKIMRESGAFYAWARRQRGLD
jgi:glycosyltransferase involved in cell wall biosynthesis